MASDIIIDDTTVDDIINDDDNEIKTRVKKRRSPTYQHFDFNESTSRWNCKYCR
jgi:hypothetical protein